MRLLNFGCGNRINEKWENIDFSPIDKRVKKVNLLKKLPYQESSFDVAYSSHFLEHLSVSQAQNVLMEIKRILKIGGILRIVVPDLQILCRDYLDVLQELKSAKITPQNLILDSKSLRGGGFLELDLVAFRYYWILLEIFDQMVRTKSGGEMQKCLDAIKDKNEFITIIKERVGAESSVPKIPLHRKITLDKISNKILHLWLRFVRALVPKSLRNEVFIQTSIGERHKFMYDEISLSSLLESVGFRNIKVLDYRTSSIPDFNSYKLDINADGSAYKGTTSLYIECEK